MASFTRKHYQAIAGIIRDTPALDNWTHVKVRRRQLAEQFADMLAADNPNFDRARFLEACDRPDEQIPPVKETK